MKEKEVKEDEILKDGLYTVNSKKKLFQDS